MSDLGITHERYISHERYIAHIGKASHITETVHTTRTVHITGTAHSSHYSGQKDAEPLQQKSCRMGVLSSSGHPLRSTRAQEAVTQFRLFSLFHSLYTLHFTTLHHTSLFTPLYSTLHHSIPLQIPIHDQNGSILGPIMWSFYHACQCLLNVTLFG